MRPVFAIQNLKRVPECNVVVGLDQVQIEYLRKWLGVPEPVSGVDVTLIKPGKFYQVPNSSSIELSDEKLYAKLGVWDAQTPLDPNSSSLKALIEEAGKSVGIKVTREQFESSQWKLFEGSGGVRDAHLASVEILQWLCRDPEPKPELPWFNPEGWFKLSQVRKSLEAYLAHLRGDEEKVKRMGMGKVARWKLEESDARMSLEILDKRELDPDSQRALLRALWSTRPRVSKSQYKSGSKS